MLKVIILVIPLFLYAVKPDLLLLKTYTNQDIKNWVMSEKLDGIRAYWNGTNLISRGGKIIHAPSWFTKDYPKFEIDGELWSKRNDFENISSIVRDKVPSDSWHEIKHYIFEVPNAKGNLYQRLSKAKKYENNYIEIIKQIKINSKEHLNNYFNLIINKKGEGVVVRDPLSPYINKRTSKALKIKSFKDDECKVIDYTQGKGKLKGLVGALVCKLPNGTIFKIGSGLSNYDRKFPPNINDIITFKYQELTKYKKPRFPVYIRVRVSK